MKLKALLCFDTIDWSGKLDYSTSNWIWFDITALLCLVLSALYIVEIACSFPLNTLHNRKKWSIVFHWLPHDLSLNSERGLLKTWIVVQYITTSFYILIGPERSSVICLKTGIKIGHSLWNQFHKNRELGVAFYCSFHSELRCALTLKPMQRRSLWNGWFTWVVPYKLCCVVLLRMMLSLIVTIEDCLALSP